MAESIILLLAGLGILLVGFKMLSDNIEKLANSGLRKLFDKTSNNRFVGVGIGAAATALIQSSGATTIMVVGFVNAGVMTLTQAAAVIMGANIGTTITAQIVALNSFDIGLYAMLLTFIGMFMSMIFKKEKIKTLGLAMSGLGLVFVSLTMMKDAMSTDIMRDTLQNLFSTVSNPFLLLFLGIFFTAVMQSSSAITSILITMVTAGISIGGGAATELNNSALYIVLGSNIGSCVTALLSSIGASPNAKRASIIHLLFNTIGAVIVFIVLICWPGFMENTFDKWFPGVPGTQLAMFHTFFNVIMTMLFLPFISLFVKASTFLIRDKKKEGEEGYIDDRFLKTPAVAINQAAKETLRLGYLAMDNLNLAIDCFTAKSMENASLVNANNANIEKINQSILSYLVKVSSSGITGNDEKLVSKLHHIVNDFYRLAEISDNMIKYTKHIANGEFDFSDKVYEQIKELKIKLNKQFDNVSQIYQDQSNTLIAAVDELENEIDDMRSDMINGHIQRLEHGECSPQSSGVYINLVSNLERAGDHLEYVAHSIVDDYIPLISDKLRAIQ